MESNDISAWLTEEEMEIYKAKLQYSKLRKYRKVSRRSIAEAETIAAALEALGERNRLMCAVVNLPNFAEHYGTQFRDILAACLAGLPREV